jgi:hypothetical protein
LQPHPDRLKISPNQQQPIDASGVNGFDEILKTMLNESARTVFKRTLIRGLPHVIHVTVITHVLTYHRISQPCLDMGHSLRIALRHELRCSVSPLARLSFVRPDAHPAKFTTLVNLELRDTQWCETSLVLENGASDWP